MRRINKLKKLYHEIDKDTKEDLNRFRMKKKCTCGFVILFLAFSIVLISDIYFQLLLAQMRIIQNLLKEMRYDLAQSLNLF